MEMTKNGDQVVATGSDNDNDSDYSNTGQHNSRGGGAGNKVAEFSSGGAPSETPVLAASPVTLLPLDTTGNGPHHIQATSASRNSRPGGAVIPADANDPDDPPWKSGSTANINSTQAPKAQGRRLTFADETGGALAEVNYSNRTHYSKQTGPSALGGTGRACCVIS